jgi:hypothetical protein
MTRVCLVMLAYAPQRLQALLATRRFQSPYELEMTGIRHRQCLGNASRASSCFSSSDAAGDKCARLEAVMATLLFWLGCLLLTFGLGSARGRQRPRLGSAWIGGLTLWARLGSA